jgi:hypothetical protein
MLVFLVLPLVFGAKYLCIYVCYVIWLTSRVQLMPLFLMCWLCWFLIYWCGIQVGVVLLNEWIIVVIFKDEILNTYYKQTPWPDSGSELYRSNDSRLSANLMPTFEDRVCHLVSVTDPYGRILGFLDRSRYFFFQVAPQLYSRGWVDSVPDPLLLRKSGSAGNRTMASGSVVRNSDH